MNAKVIGFVKGMLATVALVVCVHSQAAIIVSVSEFITYTDPPTSLGAREEMR